MKHTEHTANLALAQAPVNQGWKVGANFAKPLPKRVKQEKSNLIARMLKLGKK